MVLALNEKKYDEKKKTNTSASDISRFLTHIDQWRVGWLYWGLTPLQQLRS